MTEKKKGKGCTAHPGGSEVRELDVIEAVADGSMLRPPALPFVFCYRY